jgi:hypothetical protein
MDFLDGGERISAKTRSWEEAEARRGRDIGMCVWSGFLFLGHDTECLCTLSIRRPSHAEHSAGTGSRTLQNPSTVHHPGRSVPGFHLRGRVPLRQAHVSLRQANDPGHAPQIRLTRKVDGKTVAESFSSIAACRKAD